MIYREATGESEPERECDTVINVSCAATLTGLLYS
jgi:hypothetical protein